MNGSVFCCRKTFSNYGTKLHFEGNALESRQIYWRRSVRYADRSNSDVAYTSSLFAFINFSNFLEIQISPLSSLRTFFLIAILMIFISLRSARKGKFTCI